MTKIIFCLFACIVFKISNAQTTIPDRASYGKLNESHDIQISAWGPYSKKYAGISHVADLKSGLRFDFSVFPGHYRNKVLIPNVLFESGYFPWEVSADITRITYRYELEWKDRVYVDVTYNVIDSGTVIVKMDCVNNTSLPQNLVLNLMSFIDYPSAYPSRQVRVSKNDLWKNAVDYSSISLAKPDPQDNLVHLGYKLGEVRHSDYINSSAIAQRFGKEKGDKLTYDLESSSRGTSGKLDFVYRMKVNEQCTFSLSGIVTKVIMLKGTGKFEQFSIPYSARKDTIEKLVIESHGGNQVEFNGFFLVPENEQADPLLVPLVKNFEPEKIEDMGSKNIVLKYKDIADYYGVGWDSSSFAIRELKNDELDIYFRKFMHKHNTKVFEGNGNGNYTNVFIRPIELEAGASKSLFAMLCNGDYEKVKRQLKQFGSLKKTIAKQQNVTASDILPEGKSYEFSHKMLKATLLSNIVYPIYTQGSYIRHFNPGKWWDSLYSWDSGFIALGLNEVNLKLAIECINAYTTDKDNQSAFIHHGSPVPVQVYAFFELWSKTQSRELLAYFYPRLKQYYEFLAGRLGSSVTRNQSGMIKTWDYFYNSGGWDDYPPQVAVRNLASKETIAPVVNTAHNIRVAKILKMFAHELNRKADLKQFDNDIKLFTEALQKYSWNTESKYFSYVVHDKQGNPTGKFIDNKSGKDYNMGLDGAYPIFSGICTPEQEKILLDKIFSEKHMWTPSGIGVVDQSAPYYNEDGYWNGAVWMPHQWFMWKAMLDIGRPDLAFKIAHKALNVYSRETDESYYTFEHFLAKTGRGAGWHQFSGLSTPILSWFSAYFKPGSVTSGFEIMITKQNFNKDLTSYTADISFDKSGSVHKRSMLICLNPAHVYKATLDGKKLNVNNRYNGLVEIDLPVSNQGGTLSVSY